MITRGEQVGIPCTVMRGGTSKIFFFLASDLPAEAGARDAFLKRALGTPHPLQVDGVGGGNLLTSKVAIVGPASRDDADVDYTFAQVEVTRDNVDYNGNDGNICAAVGPFALEAGLLSREDGECEVRMFNTNTEKIIIARFGKSGDYARVIGETAVAGVEGTGAKVFLDFLHTDGSVTGKLLPTGVARQRIEMEEGSPVEVTLCDLANPTAFVRAEDVGLRGAETKGEIDRNDRVLAVLKELRGKAGVAMGLARNWRAVDEESTLLPFMGVVSGPQDYRDAMGRPVEAATVDLCARLVFRNRCHESIAATAAMCLGAAARLASSVVEDVLSPEARARDTLRIGHPSGSMAIVSRADPAGAALQTLGFDITARRIMDGTVYVPR